MASEPLFTFEQDEQDESAPEKSLFSFEEDTTSVKEGLFTFEQEGYKEPAAPDPETPDEGPGFLSQLGENLASPSVNPIGGALLQGTVPSDEYVEGRAEQIAATGRQTLGAFAEMAASPLRTFYDTILRNADPEDMPEDTRELLESPMALERFAKDQFQKAADLREKAHEKTPEEAVPKFLTEALDAIVEMAPSLGVSYLTKRPNAALATMGTTVFGRSYGQARQEGKETDEALTDAGIALLTELGPEKAVAFFDNLVLGQGVKNLVKSAAREAASEAITEQLQIEDEIFRQDKVDTTAMEAFGRIFRAAGIGATIGLPAAVPSALGTKTPPEESPVEAAERALEETETRFQDEERVTAAKETRSLEELQTEARERVAAAGGDALEQELAAADVGYTVSEQMAGAAENRREFFRRERDMAAQRVEEAKRQEEEQKAFEQREKERERERREAERQKREDEAQARVEQEVARAEEAAAAEPGPPLTQEEIEARAPEGPARGPALAVALEAAGVQQTQVEETATPVDAAELPEAEANAVVLEAANQAASSPTNTLTEPKAGAPETAYPVGEVTVQGMDLEIENAPGTERRGRLMTQPYGRFKNIQGADGDRLDVFVGPKPKSDKVYVIDQVDQNGQFDEHKVMVGYPNQLAAVRAYKSNYDEGHVVGPVTEMTVDEFQELTASGALRSPVSPQLAQPRGREGLKAKRERQGLQMKLEPRKGVRRGRPMNLQEAQERVDSILEMAPALQEYLNVVESPRNLPEEMLARMPADQKRFIFDGRVPGFVDLANGQIYVIANANQSTDELVATVLHEGVGHMGTALFNIGEKGLAPSTIHQEVFDSISKEDNALMNRIVETYGLDLTNESDQRVAGDEYIAHLAENPEADPTVWRRIVDKVREVLRDMGIVKKWTDNDIRQMLRRSADYLQRERPIEHAKLVGLKRGIIGPEALAMKKKIMEPYVPGPEQSDIPVTLISETEQSIIDVFERAEKANAEVTGQRLKMAHGAPVNSHGSPTSYPELQRMLDWAREHKPEAQHWYSQFRNGFQKLVGAANMREASFLFGLTSPQAPVDSNVQSTLIVMILARQYSPVTNPDVFRKRFKEYRNSLPPGEAGFGLTNARLEAIIDFYRTGEYRAKSMKAVSFANEVFAKYENKFHPYAVMDRHMARVFGFQVDALTDRQYRYMQYLTQKLALDSGMKSEEVQALLWYYAREHFSNYKSEGTWTEALNNSKFTVESIKKMQREGNFSRFRPFSEEVGKGPPAKFEIMGSTNKPRVVDAYSNFRHQMMIDDAARARAPSVLISLEPGHQRGYGFPADLAYEKRERYRDEVLHRITENGQIPLLQQLDIPHEIFATVGTWEGNIEPSLEIKLPGGTLQDADLVKQVLGHAFLQDSAISAAPNYSGTAHVAVVSKSDGTEFTHDEINTIYEALGMEFTAVDNSGSLKFIDDRGFDQESYTSEQLEEFAEKISSFFDGDTYNVEYTGQTGEWRDTSSVPENMEEVRSLARAKNAPDIQRTAIDPLYKSVWEAYREFGQELGYTPENTNPPVDGLPAYADPIPEPQTVQAAQPEKLQMKLLPKKLRKAVEEDPDPDSPLRTIAAQAVTVEEALTNDTPVKNMARAAKARLARGGRRAVLAAIPWNYMPDFFANPQEDVPALLSYMQNSDKMNGRKLELLHAPEEFANKWHKWGKAQPDMSRVLGELMLASTYAEIDVSRPYRDFKDSSPQERRQRKAVYRRLRKFYTDKLDSTGRELYKKVNKDFRTAAKLREDTLIKQIQDSQAPKAAKTGLQQFLRKKFEAGRIRGYYFPLHRDGNHWAAALDGDGEIASYAMFDTETRRDDWAQLQREAGYQVKTGEKFETEAHQTLQEIDPEFVRQVENKLAGVPGTAELRDEIWQMYLKNLPEVSVRKSYIHRKGVLGFTGDVIKAYSHAMYHAAAQQARLEYAPRLREDMAALDAQLQDINVTGDGTPHPDAKWADLVQAEMKHRHEMMMHPKASGMATLLTGVGFAWFLGTTPAAALVNLTQTPIFGLPTLASRFNSWGRAAKALSGAYKDVLRFKGPMKMGEYLKGDDARAFEEFVRRGVTDQTRGHDLIGLAHDGVEIPENVKTAQHVASWLFHNAEVVNRAVTVMAAYRMSRDAGRGHKRAVEEAMEVSEMSHYNYSGFNRPRFMQSSWGRVIFQFRNYSLNATYRLVRDFRDGFLPTLKNNEQRTEAKKRFAGILGMTALLGGLRSLPVWGPTMLLLNALLADDEEEFDAEAATWAYLEEQWGETFTRALRTGVVDTWGGVTLSTRVSLNNLWLRELSQNKKGADKFREIAAQLAGPSVGIAEAMFHGVSQIAEGEARGWERVIPKVLGDQLKAIRLATEGARTYDKDIIIPKEDFNILELAGQSAGFTPSKLSEQYSQNRVYQDLSRGIEDRRTRLMSKYYLAFMYEDDTELDAVQERIDAFNKAHPQREIDLSSIMSSIEGRMKTSIMSDKGVYLHPDLQYLREQFGYFGDDGQVIPAEEP